MLQQREYYRIKYPITQRPRLVAEDVDFEVVELSESGARVTLAATWSATSQRLFDAAISFQDGKTVIVKAKVVRQEADEVILQFADNLPYSVIASEQRRLLQIFPREARV